MKKAPCNTLCIANAANGVPASVGNVARCGLSEYSRFVWGHALRMLVTHFRAAPAQRTFPSRLPVFALDRIWMHPADRLIDVTVHRSTRARVASDHLPLVARIAREHHY